LTGVLPPESGMVLCAGLGTRMRPITDHLPKPLVPVAGRALLDHTLDRLALAKLARVVINLHYKGEMIRRHLQGRSDLAITFSEEPVLLDTGGGVLQALPELGEFFYVVNADVFWLDGLIPALTRLARGFAPERMDGLLLLARTSSAVGYEGPGDLFIDPLGALRRRGEREIAPHLFAGIQLLHRRLFEGLAPGTFSLNRLYDRALGEGRLEGIVHDGSWYHVGTPEGLAATEARLSFQGVER